MEKLIRQSGNSRKLLSYQKTEVIFHLGMFFLAAIVNHLNIITFL